MAKMYPEVFPGKFDQEDPEFVVYQCLRKLPDSYVVLYSRRLKGGLFGKPECEIDFLIANQRDVLICLEVKGGLMAYDGANDRWIQNGRTMDKNPDRQAAEATHALLGVLPKELSNVNVDWALCFPQCSLASDKEVIGIPHLRIIDETKLLRIEEEIRKIEGGIRNTFRKRGITAVDARHLLDRLTRGIGFVQALGVRIAREAEQIIQVTNEQYDVLADLEINPRLIIHGSAGTGKTILAQAFAKRLDSRGMKVLLLFYNKGIAAKVRHAFDKRGNVEVGTFSSFAKRLVESIKPDWWEKHQKKSDEFWTLELPTTLLDIPLEKLPKFDAVIVDEGQDFKPEWFEFLQQLLSDPKQCFLTVFLDEHQDIFHHWKHFPSSPQPAKKVLTKNCRNTRRIVEYLNSVYPTEMTWFERSPTGAPIVQRHVNNSTEEQTQLVRDIKNLISTEHVAPGQIVILLSSSKAESCLANTNKIAGFPLESTYNGYDPKAKKIYYSTISIFKGLEADVVFVMLDRILSADELAKALYVRASRAKHLLYVYNRID
jgi:hypothetical protein